MPDIAGIEREVVKLSPWRGAIELTSITRISRVIFLPGAMVLGSVVRTALYGSTVTVCWARLGSERPILAASTRADIGLILIFSVSLRANQIVSHHSRILMLQVVAVIEEQASKVFEAHP